VGLLTVPLSRGVHWAGVAWIDEDGALACERGIISRESRTIPAGGVLYLVSGVESRAIERVMGPADTLTRTARRWVVLTLRGLSSGRKGSTAARTRVYAARSWGMDSGEPAGLSDELEALQAAVADEGWTWSSTASGQAARLMPRAHQDPAFVRALGHRGLHSGPQRVRRAYSPFAVAVDIRAAYLEALRQPVPHRWIALSWPMSWRRLRREEGIARVRVRAGSACLPEDDTRNLWPTGTFWTTAPLPVLRAAEDFGNVQVLEVAEAALCSVSRLYAGAAARMDAIQCPVLRKRLYVRSWGRLASTGAWVGRARGTGGIPWIGSALDWSWDGLGHPWAIHRPEYRPTHAAYISGRCHAMMIEGAAGMEWGSILGEHVDCIWTEDTDAANALVASGQWALKGTGRLRLYGIGCYDHEGQLGASGYDASKLGELTPRKLQRWASQASISSATWTCRQWDGHPAQHRWALSAAHHRDPEESQQQRAPWVVTDRRFSEKGWADVDRLSEMPIECPWC